MGEFVRGFGYGFKGLAWLRAHPGLARYWLPPVLLTLIAFVLAQYLALDMYDDLLEVLWQRPSSEPGFVGWLVRAAYSVTGFVTWVVSSLLALVLTLLLSMIVAAPFNDALSEAVERTSQGGSAPDFRFADLVRDVGRTVSLEALKLSCFLGIMGPLWLASWLLPGVGQALYVFGGALFSAAYLALDYVDWPASRRRWPISARVGLLRRHPGLLLGFGASVWVLLLIPVLSLFLMPAAVAGGTLLFLQLPDVKAESALSPGD